LEENKPKQEFCAPRIFPSGFTELILYYGDKYLHIDKNNSKTLQPYFYLSGQSNTYYDIQPTGKIGLIAITFKPDAAKLFFKLPVSELEDNFVAIEEIAGQRAKELEYKLQVSANNKERLNLLEEFLIKQLREFYTKEHKRINYSIDLINRNKGLITVENLADYACLGTKQFKRRFTDFVGIKPKKFTRIVRFQHAIYSQQIKSVKNPTELAYKCGYYDQAHFTNEFKEFTGYTPKEFFTICEPYSDYFS